jgi:hypothetical protein
LIQYLQQQQRFPYWQLSALLSLSLVSLRTTSSQSDAKFILKEKKKQKHPQKQKQNKTSDLVMKSFSKVLGERSEMNWQTGNSITASAVVSTVNFLQNWRFLWFCVFFLNQCNIHARKAKQASKEAIKQEEGGAALVKKWENYLCRIESASLC